MKHSIKLILSLMVMAVTLMAASVASAQTDDDGDRLRGPRGDRERGQIMAVIEQETGLSGLELMQAMRDGATLAEVLEANGSSVEAVTDLLLADATDQINQRVEDGQLTQERADELLANLETRVTDALNGERAPIMPREREGRPGARGRDGERMDLLDGILRDNLEALEIDREAVRAAMQGGATLNEALEVAGVDVDALAADVRADVEMAIAEAVAAGDLTQERADALLERLDNLLTNRGGIDDAE